jgi:SAM-dependent methyltransferase
MCNMCDIAVSREGADAFAGKVLAVLNHGAVAVMLSIGHRTGLFDTMAALPAATSAEIAAAAGLNERYVREWLGAMATGGIVEYEEATKRYRLPPEHALSLTRSSPAGNMAVFAQYVAMFGATEEKILPHFREGGGLPYSAFPRFHAVMAEDSGQSLLPALVEQVLPLAPGLRERLEDGIDVLDVGCGRGRALMLMAERFPNSRFTGYDISGEAIGYARAHAEMKGLSNLRLLIEDAASFDDAAAYDLVTTFDAVHDQARPDLLLRNIARALKPGGVYLMQDIDASSELARNLDHPLGPFLYTTWTLHCMTVSLAAGGMGLGTVWGVETAERMLRETGFASVEIHRLPHDVQNAYYVNRLAA